MWIIVRQWITAVRLSRLPWCALTIRGLIRVGQALYSDRDELVTGMIEYRSERGVTDRLFEIGRVFSINDCTHPGVGVRCLIDEGQLFPIQARDAPGGYERLSQNARTPGAIDED